MVLVGIVIYGAAGVMRHALPALLDQSVEETAQMKIVRALTDRFENYRQLHGVRTRVSGNTVIVELFIEYDPDMSVGELMKRSGELSERVRQLLGNADVLVIPCDHHGMKV